MRFIGRLFLTFSLLAFLFGFHNRFFTSEVLAAGEFETSYKVSYNVDEKGKTRVSQQIVLKNKTSNFYADKFELKIGSTKVEDVQARDTAGPLETEVKFENNLTNIGVKFNQKVIGIGKTLSWNLEYTSNELAAKSGQIWEVSIPRLARSGDIAEYEATVIAPTSFGPVAFAVPQSKIESKVGNTQQFIFNKEQLIESGISISFGQKQVFAFLLNYHLENKNLTSQIQEVALPPDNNYQKVVIEKLNPTPFDVMIDKDNNYLAKYKLSPGQKINIVAGGYVEVFSKPFRNIYQALSPQQKSLYLEKQKYWDTENTFIKKKAEELKTPKEIYDFVSGYLSYSQERLTQPKIERKGAGIAYSEPKDAVCTEFTDLFIAISRAAGIPAREVEGFAYTQNERLRPLSLALYPGDVLHAWPEYWDEKLGWVQVDPTWGSTSGGLNYFDKLDFNHITFVQRGVSSQTPLPAGSYKSGSYAKKDIAIEFAQDLPSLVYRPEISIITPPKVISGIPLKLKIAVNNNGNITLDRSSLTLSAKKLKRIISIEKPLASEDNSIDIDALPPFARRIIEIRLTTKNVLEKSQDIIWVSYMGKQVSASVLLLPIYSLIFVKNFLISLLIASLITFSGLALYKKQHSRKKGKI